MPFRPIGKDEQIIPIQNQGETPQRLPPPLRSEESFQPPFSTLAGVTTPPEAMSPGPSLPQPIKQAIAPTIGATAGAMIPLIPGLQATAPFAPVMSAALAAGGEALNQFLGITEPSPEQILLEGGLTALGPAFPIATRAARRFITPSTSAKTLNEVAPKEAERFIKRLRPQEQAKVLFEQATQQGGRIPMFNTNATLDKLISEMEKASTPPSVLNNLKNLKAKIIESGDDLDPANLQQELEIIGRTVGRLEAKEGSPFGASKLLFESMMDDLDAAASIPGAKTLKKARDVFRRSRSVDTIEEFISNATKSLRGQGEAVQFNSAEVIRNLKKDKFFPGSFTAKEQSDIYKLLNKINKIPALKPGAGQQFGSGRRFGQLVTGGVGGTYGAVSGDPLTATIGVAGGALLPPTFEVGKNLALAISMKEGRDLIRRLLTPDGTLTQQAMTTIGAFLASRFADPGQENLPPPLRQYPITLPGTIGSFGGF